MVGIIFGIKFKNVNLIVGEYQYRPLPNIIPKLLIVLQWADCIDSLGNLKLHLLFLYAILMIN